jgi:hypothetical protein
MPASIGLGEASHPGEWPRPADIESWEIRKQPRVAVISKPFTMEEFQAKLA